MALGWGMLAGSTLLLGPLVARYARVPRPLLGLITAFGSGVLIAAVTLELMEDAFKLGGFTVTAIGFLLGGFTFTLANMALCHYGARHRKRSGGLQPSEEEHAGSGAAIAIGALLDGVPESMVLGISLLSPHGMSAALLTAVLISNFPESLASAAGMQRAGRSTGYIFGVWGSIAAASALAALLGYTLLDQVAPAWIAFATALAAGAVLAMLADTMIPEAFEEVHIASGLSTVGGFLLAFIVAKQQIG